MIRRPPRSALFPYTSHFRYQIHVDLDASNDRFSTNTVFLTNTWYHVAMTYDGTLAPASRVNVYVNGLLDKTASETSASIPNYASSLTLAKLAGTTSYFSGALDNVRIYNRALSSAEVLNIYTAENGVAYWKFDEGSGTTAADSSGFANAGTVNGPTWTSGEIGGALNFDGVNDYVSVPDASNL